MRRIKLLALIMILGLTLKGQSYQPFSDQNVSFFKNANNKISALKVVGKQQRNDTVEYKFNSVWDLNDYRNITPNGIAWNGNKCICVGDTYYFFNSKQYSIKIMPLEKINSSWIAYKFSNDDMIVARISRKEIISLLGVSDSIKTISFQRQTKAGIAINDLINDAFLKISKNYGFVKVFEFKVFPEEYIQQTLIGMTNPALGLTYLTNKEIYNFDIDDEFHYDIAYSNPPNGTGRFSKVIKKVIDKQYSNNNDTVIYTFEIKDDMKLYDWSKHTQSQSITIETEKEKYVVNGKSLFVPDEPITDRSVYYLSYSLEIDNNNRRNFIPSTDMFSKDGDTWSYVFYDPPTYSIYKEGCGLFDYNADDSPGASHETMVYYKKGSETWGTPYSISSITDFKNDKIAIYPNPINNGGKLNVILSNNSISSIELFNSYGTSISKIGNINNSNFELNVSNLLTGIYLIKIIDTNKNIITKKIVK